MRILGGTRDIRPENNFSSSKSARSDNDSVPAVAPTWQALGDGLARLSGVAAYLPLGNQDNSYRPSPGHRDGLCGSTTRKICALHHPATLSGSGSGTCSVTKV